MGSGTRRRAGEGRQGRAPARGIPRADRSRSGADRAEPVGRRADRARSAAALRRAPRRLDRHVRRRLPRARARRDRSASRSRATRSVRSWRAARSARHAAERPRPLRAFRRASPTRSWPCSRELESGLLEPEQLDGDLALLYASYREELDRLGLWDRDLLRRRAVERLRSELDAWDGRPVFAYGFEDLTGAEWGLLEALAARAEVTVSLPYEPGRAAFASLRRTQEDLAALAGGQHRGAPAAAAEYGHAALAHLERASLRRHAARRPARSTAPSASSRAPGARGSLELVAEEIRELAARRHAARGDRARRPFRRALARAAGDRARHPRDPVRDRGADPPRPDAVRAGAALAAPLRVAAGRPPRPLRLPPLAVLGLRAARTSTSSKAGCAAAVSPRGKRSRRRRSGFATASRCRRSRPCAARSGRWTRSARLAAAMLRERARPRRAARRRGEPRPTCAPTTPLARAARRARRLARARRRARRRDEVLGALEHAEVAAGLGRRARPRRRPRPRARPHPPLRRRLPARARGGDAAAPRRRVAVPRRRRARRRSTSARARGSTRPDPVERERYLFYTACTRATQRLTLVREAATDEGSPREPSPFWDEVAALFDPDDVRALDAPAAALTADLGARGRADRARAAAGARPARRDASRRTRESIAIANGWERRLARARGAFTRETELRHPRVLAELAAKTPFNVTELERFADCSSAWFFERLISPRQIDREVDAMLRGSVAHTTLHRFYAGLPRAIGSDRVDEARLDDALVFLGECLEGALAGREDGDDRARAARARAEPAPRPRAARPRRGALAGAARAAQVRGRVRLRAVGARAAARARPRRRDHALRQDRPDRRRPGQRPRDRPGLQVRAHAATRRPRSRRSFGSRSRSTCSCCATSSGSSRSAGSTGRWRASAGRAGCSAPRRRSDVLPGFVDERLPRRGRVLGAGRGRARPRARAGAADPRGRRASRPEGDGRLSGLVRPLADVPDQASMRTPNEQQAAAIAARGQVFVSAGAGTGKTTVLVERFVEAVCERGHRRRVDARDHLHGACRGRAARPDPRAPARARPPRPGALARRRVDLDDPRLLPAAAEVRTRSPPGSTRASASSTTARAASSAARRSRRR